EEPSGRSERSKRAIRFHGGPAVRIPVPFKAVIGWSAFVDCHRCRKLDWAVAGFSDEGEKNGPRRTLILIAFSSIATFSMRSRTTLARSAGEGLRTAVKWGARLNIFRIWSL